MKGHPGVPVAITQPPGWAIWDWCTSESLLCADVMMRGHPDVSAAIIQPPGWAIWSWCRWRPPDPMYCLT